MLTDLKARHKIKSLMLQESNETVEWLALLLRIWEVWGSNLGPETGYPN
jgi:hypothetical protein